MPKYPSIKIFKLCLIYLILLVGPVVAEDPARGRLPDGRAFRTDDQGVQLVDYIAELELTVEGLQRQVSGLESEVQEKQAIISGLQRGEAAPLKISERDISNTAAVANLERTATNTKCENFIDQLKQCSQVIEDQKIELQVSAEKHRTAIEESENKAKTLATQLGHKEEENNFIRAKLADLEKEFEVQQLNAKEVQDEILSESAKRASLRSVDGGTVVNMPSNLDRSRSMAVDALRVRMIKDLGSMQSPLATRNDLYPKYKKLATNSKLTFAEASQIQDKLNKFRQRLQAAYLVHELSDIRNDMNRLRGELQQEIALMRRVVR